MNQLQVFNHELFGELTVEVIETAEMFDVHNVAWSLGYTRQSKGTDYLRYDRVNAIIEKLDIATVDRGGQLYIDESGLYDFVFEAGTSRAREFRKWVTSEVLPSIRKTSTYQIEKPNNTKLLLQSALQHEERLETVETDVKYLKDHMRINGPQEQRINRNARGKIVECLGGNRLTIALALSNCGNSATNCSSVRENGFVLSCGGADTKGCPGNTVL